MNAPHKPEASARMLFIGNSFTARNDVPGLITKIAARDEVQVESKLLSMGGASLRMHWNKGAALKEITSGQWDYVVLQEQSTLPIKNAARMRENVLLFHEPIRTSGAKAVLYMTWARKHAPATQQQIADAYESVGREMDAIVIPAGLAWQRFMKDHNQPVLHDKDGSHPTLAGSYLAACVFCATLFGSVTAIEVGGLSEDDAKLLSRTVTLMQK
jgi:hypothetical protein